MEFRTQVTIEKPPFLIEPCEEILFVGSCFADAIGQRFRDEAFPVTVNPFGVMYNPASILHTIERLAATVPAVSPAGSETSEAPVLYHSLDGRRVNTPKKGLYIRNGRKVVIK